MPENGGSRTNSEERYTLRDDQVTAGAVVCANPKVLVADCLLK